MSNLKFTKEHEWLDVDGNTVTIGITKYAEEQLGDVVFVELPDEGSTISVDDEIAVIESVKAAEDIKSPVSGTVVAVNSELVDSPEKLNEDPMGSAWLFKVEVEELDESELLSEDEYESMISDE